MNLPNDFLDILCCPKRQCRGNLAEKDKNGKFYLKCKICGEEYPVLHQIPILFPNADHSPNIHERHWDLEANAASYAKKYNKYLKKQGAPWGLYTHESELKAINKLAQNTDLKGKTILDCGSGNGRFLSSHPEAKTKIGIDTSLLLLKDNKEREPEFWLVCGQLEDMPFKDAIADYSVSIRVFQHIKVPAQAFSEMARVTKPSGHVSLEIYNKLNLKEIYKRFRMLPFMAKKWPWGLEYDRYFSFREIEKWCSDNFIKPIRYAGAGWGIHFYLFDLIQFKRFVPRWLQKSVYDFFLFLEDIVGTWPFFSKTMEKICFIGSLQARSRKTDIIKKIIDKIKFFRDVKKAKIFERELIDRNYCLSGNDEYHLRTSINWIKKAQDATADSGVSRGFSLIKNPKCNDFGWQPSYPETTGYIIPTMIKAGVLFNDPDLTRRAKLMADWELNIMFPDGAVHGGNIATKPNRAVFDTGQVIRGLAAIYNETKEIKYLEAAKKSANWILNNEKDKSGIWMENNAACVDSETTTYNTYAIAPIVEMGMMSNIQEFKDLGKRAGQVAISKQNKNGWFKDADFQKRDDALLHPIAYTIDGLWDIGYSLDNYEFKDSASKAIDGVLSRMDSKGFIPGRFSSDWQPTVKWACLTGSAQIGVICMKMYRENKQEKYLEAAHKIKEFLKTCQNNYKEEFGGIGAIWGSWPISGEYGRYEALNWAVKYFADLLIYFIENDKIINNKTRI